MEFAWEPLIMTSCWSSGLTSRIGSRLALIEMLHLVCSPQAFAVRPFVTDDARIVNKGQLEIESFAGVTMAKGNKPVVEARSLQGMACTDRFELVVGGFCVTYQDD